MTKLCLSPESTANPAHSTRSYFLVLCWLLSGVLSFAQMETATVSGTVMDHTGAVVADAQVQVTNSDTNVTATTSTNGSGIYVVTSLRPGRYRIAVTKVGFKQVVVTDVVLNVQDVVSRNFNLEVGAVSESITVSAGAYNVNTTDATVSTVVDRQFAENLPLNGRSFQTLIQLTPGVVLTPSTTFDSGQFSVNGQRGASNYWTVDGASANIGVGAISPGNGLGGTLGSFSALGGTNSLVSVDALQEFRIQTSTYAPEFGRTPGGQISIVTRSGTNQWHGAAFDYFRNDLLDANNWFNTSVTPAIPKAKERQNDFGGTLSGPILKDRAFFFFSYEGLRLRLPQTAFTDVPSRSARQAASPALQPFMNAFPLPSPDTPDTGPNPAPFNTSFSNPASLDAYSLRIDHKLSDKINLFGRYNYSPSNIDGRGGQGTAADALSVLATTRYTVQTATVGATWAISPVTADEFRFNYSRTNATGGFSLDTFGGAAPLTSLPSPAPFNAQNSQFIFGIFSLADGFLVDGRSLQNVQRQFNIIDNLFVVRGSHSLKFGVDFRRLSPLFNPSLYLQAVFFNDVPSAQAGNLSFALTESGRSGTFLFHNLGVFAQDTWRVVPRLTVTYGLRWDVDFSPSSINGPSLASVTGYNLNDLSNLALAPAGTPPFSTRYGNIAPRIGVAYQVRNNQDKPIVVRGGFGGFYDLVSSEVGNGIFGAYPFGAFNNLFAVPPSCSGSTFTFPLDSCLAAPPPITPAQLSSVGASFSAFDPRLRLPYTLEWNVALDQGFGSQQTLSVSYIGSVGRRLLQTAEINSPNQNFNQVSLIGNTAKSNYNGLQVQYQRRLSHGLQALASYSWSHSIDTASAGSFNGANGLGAGLDPNANRGPSDFDVRNAFSTGLTYNVPFQAHNAFANALLHGWSLQSIVQAHSATPVSVYYSQFGQMLHSTSALIRPDVVPGIPLYLYGSQFPGGKIFNNTPNQGGLNCIGPFCPPPTDNNGVPLRQGNLGRNALRGFGLTQWDLGVHRDFPIRESLTLQFRAEMFNVLNHPDFAPPIGDLVSPQSANPQFGMSTQLLGQYLSGGNVGGGAFSPLYQIGGPRSIQFALKLAF
jgi:hypothetical protein